MILFIESWTNIFQNLFHDYDYCVVIINIVNHDGEHM